MQRRNVRSALRALRAKTSRLLLAPAAIGAAMTLLTASPANAAVLWTPTAISSFGYTACDGGNIEYRDYGDGHGPMFHLYKPVGYDRCEVADSSTITWSNNNTYWFGWTLWTDTNNAQTVFQWKSWGTDAQQQQNYPVIMKVENGSLKIWYVSTGEVWNSVASVPWTEDAYNKLELGITTSSGSGGSLALYLNGNLVGQKTGIRTWDDMGNNPRWGTYGSTINGVASNVWIDDLKMGQTRADVD
ncbi:hypothetical protein ACH429_03215 [Streptomyces pathocidini]|uniref:Uncharacterized protein n=1 Tax=Streptomyces pathocidini TaxID=1650571 RepID=A0ABW7UKF1_9ACTN